MKTHRLCCVFYTYTRAFRCVKSSVRVRLEEALGSDKAVVWRRREDSWSGGARKDGAVADDPR